jgi:hypothetical protein
MRFEEKGRDDTKIAAECVRRMINIAPQRSTPRKNSALLWVYADIPHQ